MRAVTLIAEPTDTSKILWGQARRILLSYSSEGHVNLDLLRPALARLGDVRVHKLAYVGRYRPNVAASIANAKVCEYLITVEKAAVSTTRAPELAVA